jgi:beta-fructofuranosidase
MSLSKNTKWTKSNTDLFRQNIEQVKKDKLFRPIFHITPYSGLINDPVGLVYDNNWYYIGYQWYPFGPIHGLKHWGLVKTKDFINYVYDSKPMIVPNEVYEKTGSYSGSVFVYKDNKYILYTGDYKDENGKRTESTILKDFKKDNKKLLFDSNQSVINDSTGHFRDPFIYEFNGTLYCLLGNQSKSKKGNIAIWKSKSIDGKWSEMKALQVKGIPSNSYMIECPNISYDKSSETGILIYCAQGMKAKPIHQVFYQLFKDPDISSSKLNKVSKPLRLDYGFDFYAPQIITNQPNTFFGWLGMSDSNEYYSNKYGWANCLTLPRDYEYVKQSITIRPNSNVYGLIGKENKKYNTKISRASFIKVEQQAFKLKIMNKDEDHISLDVSSKGIKFSRKNQTHKNPDSYGNEISVDYQKYSSVEIFIDHSTIEIFFISTNITITSRFFIDGNLKVQSNCDLSVFDMKGIVKDEK